MRRQGEFGYGALDDSEGSFLQANADENSFRSLIEKTGSSIQRISSKVSNVERSVRQIGTPSDSVHLRNKIATVLQEINHSVVKTQTDVKRLKDLGRSLSKENRLQEERITSQFKNTVQRFAEVQKRVANQMKTYPDLPKQSSFHQEEQEVGFDSGRDVESQRRRQMQQQEEEGMEYDLNILEERERQVRDIESAIVDVNEIFRDLSAMVVEQGDMVDSIESNVERGADNVSSAREELVKAEMYQKKARRKQLCIVLILGVVVGALVLMIILLVKKP
ncbi:syntaxin-7-like [Apostichopus japonicus]|uniref:syntaxin-7-like n=1 Tax=Stichopus japonicus TaxID=307972 RepID=UPI003AB52287